MKKEEKKTLIRRGLALATSSIIGALTPNIAAKMIDKEIVPPVTKIFTEELEYNPEIIDNEGIYTVGKGTLLKATYNQEDKNKLGYYKVEGICNSKISNEDICEFNLSELNFQEDLYIPAEDVRIFDVFTTDQNNETSVIRTSPDFESENIIETLKPDTSFYIEGRYVKLEGDINWHQVLYETDNKTVAGYIAFNKELPDFYHYTIDLANTEPIEVYLYVPKKSRLYNEEELNDMYYKVLPKNGIYLYEDSETKPILLPQGSIVRSSSSTLASYGTSKKANKYKYLKCITELEDGEYICGYVPYKYEDELYLKRIPYEELNQEKEEEQTNTVKMH